MNFFIGVDCQEFTIFKKTSLESNPTFYSKIFTPAEISYCRSKAFPPQHFAARFAAKEAVIKVLSPQKIQHNQIEILNDEYGRPHVKLKNKKMSNRYIFKLSISHTKTIAFSVVLGLEKAGS